MTFSDVALSKRLERAEGQAAKDFALARQAADPESGACWREIAGTWAVFDGAESPVTQTFGLGLFEELTAEALDEIEGFFKERGAAVMHEVSPMAGIGTVDLLCERGYRPMELSSVMYREVGSLDWEKKDSIAVRVVGADEAAVWADVSARGWSDEYPEMRDAIRQFGLLAVGRTNGRCFLAEYEGEPGAAGVLCLHEGVALFGGASTVPELRRRGLQGALLAERMEYAREQGFDMAMMVTAVGTQSQRNAERIGFRIAYTRTKWRLGV